MAKTAKNGVVPECKTNLTDHHAGSEENFTIFIEKLKT